MARHPSNYWIRAGALAGFGDLAAQLGRSPASMIGRFGLPSAMLDEPELRISYPAACRMLEACADEWMCPDFGLRLGQVQHLDVLGPIGLIARISANVGEALRALRDQMNAHSSAIEMGLVADDDGSDDLVAATYVPKPGAGAGRQKLELAMSTTRNVIAILAGDSSFAPASVSFACSPPASSVHARTFFRCPVRYGQPATRLLFRTEMLSRPTAIRDPAIAPLVRRYVDQINEQNREDIVATTRRLIHDILSSGRCTRQVVADYLNMHPRTFQRRLEQGGATFSDLLDEHRKALAMDLLERRTLSFAEIAGMLGYADQSVFNQAFRRWTEKTPGTFRARE